MGRIGIDWADRMTGSSCKDNTFNKLLERKKHETDEKDLGNDDLSDQNKGRFEKIDKTKTYEINIKPFKTIRCLR